MQEERGDQEMLHRLHPPSCDVGSSINVQLVRMTWANVISMVRTLQLRDEWAT